MGVWGPSAWAVGQRTIPIREGEATSIRHMSWTSDVRVGGKRTKNCAAKILVSRGLSKTHRVLPPPCSERARECIPLLIHMRDIQLAYRARARTFLHVSS
jgi:hypothetical protein